jgi:hypothetical protein
MNLKSTAANVGRAALRAGTVAAVVTTAKQIRRRATAARRAQNAKRVGVGVAALALLVTAGILIKNRM